MAKYKLLMNFLVKSIDCEIIVIAELSSFIEKKKYVRNEEKKEIKI
jgi:hypothetical protein